MHFGYEANNSAASTETVDTEEPQDIQQFCDKAEHSKNMLNGFAKLYESPMFTDVILCAGGKEFPCHRHVLAVSSPYFMAMFINDMAEKNQGKITLHSIDSQTLQLVLDYIYSGTVKLSKDTVQELLLVADMFQLVSLKTGCASFMINHVDIRNCIGVYYFALAHGCISLANVAKDTINQQFSTLYHEIEFLALPADTVVKIIRDDGLCVSQEEVVYEACMAWLKHDLSKRIGSLDDILNHVRFANISSYYFCDKIESDMCLLSDKNLQRILYNVRHCYLQKNRHVELGLNLMPRSGMNFKRGILIIANSLNRCPESRHGFMEILFPKTGAVQEVCALPEKVRFPGCAVTGDNQIYVAGGKTWDRDNCTFYKKRSDNLSMFDQASATWMAKAKMTTPRSHFGLTVVDGYMYAIGGRDREEKALSSVEKYNIQSNVWTVVESLPQPLFWLSSVAFRGKLYVAGGTTSEMKNSATVYRYCPRLNEWTELPSMATGKYRPGSVVHKNKIYVIGGRHCASVEIFDPETETWSAGPKLPNGTDSTSCVSYDGKFVTFFDESKEIYWLQEEDGQEVWMEGEELSTTMRDFVCVVANLNKPDNNTGRRQGIRERLAVSRSHQTLRALCLHQSFHMST